MCNVSGNLHGGCGAWLVDHCSSLALLALSGGDEQRWTTSGVSTNLNLNYLKAAPVSLTSYLPSTELISRRE
jgi:acyl-coenzyme A thioesterase 13